MMRQLETCFIFVTASALLFACVKRQESNPEVKRVRDAILNVRHSLAQGRSGYSRNENRLALVGLIDSIPDDDQRVELADLYVKEILDFNLLAIPYRYRECSTIYYFEYLEMALKVMRSANFSDRQIIDSFFKGLSKYREVCIGVPLSSKTEEESLTDYSWRSDCAKKLFKDYAQRMDEIQRFWIPDLAKFLPMSVHGEFKNRIMPFLELPNEREFFNASMPVDHQYPKVISPVSIPTKLKRAQSLPTQE